MIEMKKHLNGEDLNAQNRDKRKINNDREKGEEDEEESERIVATKSGLIWRSPCSHYFCFFF